MTELHREDFVRARLPGTKTVIDAAIIDIVGDEDPEYIIREYVPTGATRQFYRVNREHLTIHPSGRLDVLDEPSTKTDEP